MIKLVVGEIREAENKNYFLNYELINERNYYTR